PSAYPTSLSLNPNDQRDGGWLPSTNVQCDVNTPALPCTTANCASGTCRSPHPPPTPPTTPTTLKSPPPPPTTAPHHPTPPPPPALPCTTANCASGTCRSPTPPRNCRTASIMCKCCPGAPGCAYDKHPPCVFTGNSPPTRIRPPCTNSTDSPGPQNPIPSNDA